MDVTEATTDGQGYFIHIWLTMRSNNSNFTQHTCNCFFSNLLQLAGKFSGYLQLI